MQPFTPDYWAPLHTLSPCTRLNHTMYETQPHHVRGYTITMYETTLSPCTRLNHTMYETTLSPCTRPHYHHVRDSTTPCTRLQPQHVRDHTITMYETQPHSRISKGVVHRQQRWPRQACPVQSAAQRGQQGGGFALVLRQRGRSRRGKSGKGRD